MERLIQTFSFLESGEMVTKDQAEGSATAWTLKQYERRILAEYQPWAASKRFIDLSLEELMTAGDLRAKIVKAHRDKRYFQGLETDPLDEEWVDRLTKGLADYGWATVWPVMAS